MINGDMEEPDKLQSVTPFQVQLQAFHETVRIGEEIRALKSTVQALSETLSVHLKQTNETFVRMNEFIGDQMSYRLFRERIEENDLQLELAKKEVQLEYLAKQYDALQKEQKIEDEESRKLQLAYETQKLEIEHMKKTQEMMQDVKKSTKDRIQSVKAQAITNPLSHKVKEAVVLTSVGTLTAAVIGGVIAFVIFFIRFYIQNTP